MREVKPVKGQLTITFKRTINGDYYIIKFKVNDEPIKFHHINTEPPLKDGIGLIIFGGKVTILPKEQIRQNLPKPLIKGAIIYNTHDIKQELNMSYSEYDYNYVIKIPLSLIEEANKFINFLVQNLTTSIINLFIDAGIDIELHTTIKKEIPSNQVEQEDISNTTKLLFNDCNELVEYLNNNEIAITVGSREEYYELIDCLSKAGIWWGSGKDLDAQPIFYDGVAYNIEDKKLYHSSKSYYQLEGFKIINWSDIEILNPANNTTDNDIPEWVDNEPKEPLIE